MGKTKFQLLEKILACLKDSPEKRFTGSQIAKWIFENYPKDCEEKRQRSNDAIRYGGDEALIKQITSEIGVGTLKKTSEVKITEGRPRKYYYTELPDDDAELTDDGASTKSNVDVNNDEKNGISEKDLYPILSDFLLSEFNVYSKRIDEKTSSNTHGKRGNKWLHPDLVGIKTLNADWNDNVKKLVKECGDRMATLWSFEVKKKIDRSGVRKDFFQAVSNSSWANFGYLVSNEIGPDALSELRILSSLHGIGYIQLNKDDPSESLVWIPARERSEVDWDSVNRLAKENTDFKKYVDAVELFYSSTNNHIDNRHWDVTPVDDDD